MVLSMQLQEDRSDGGYLIVGHAPGEVWVNERRLTASCIVSPGQLVDDWPPQSLAELTVGHVARLVELRPEIVLLGVGDVLRLPPPELLEPLQAQAIGCEVMDTPAACRTYNLLRGDGRRVVAALMMTVPPRS